MVDIPDIKRPSKEIIDALRKIGSATVSGELSRLGIRDPYIQGPVSWTPGKTIAGPAITLQFMPIREDVYHDDEYTDPEEQLHRHALYIAKPGDVVVVDARGEMTSGVFGEMMLTFFQGQGGSGVVIDGCIRDYTHAKNLDIGMWLRGVTPNYHTQTTQFPHAVNVPISCGGTLVLPGDIIVADDDGAVVVPEKYALQLANKGGEHSDWEVFVRMKLAEGGHLRDYYPRKSWSEEIDQEYQHWCLENQVEYHPFEQQ